MKNLILSLVVLFVSFVGFSQTANSVIGSDLINNKLLDDLILASVNEKRAEVGVPKLIYCSKIHKFAKSHSEWMVNNNRYEHSNMEGVNGECITAGFLWSDLTYLEASNIVVNNWMNSSPHKKILLDKRFKLGGVHASEHDNKSMGTGFPVKVTFGLK